MKRKPIKSQVAGLIIAALLIIIGSIYSMSGNASRPGSGWISYIVIIIALAFFINLYGKANDNYVSFGDLFSYGFKSISLTTLVYLIFIVILAFAMPEMKQKAIDAARAEMSQQKNFSENDIQSGLQLIEKYFWVFVAGATMLSFLVAGAVGSLLGAAITPKKGKVLVDQLDQPNS